MCRFAPIAPSSGYLTTLWCLAGGFSRLVLRSVQSQTWLPPRAALLAQACRVAPVVNALFTSKRRTLSTWLPGRVAKTPRTDSHHPSRGLESSAARLYPRSRSRSPCSGTGTITSAASLWPSAFTNSASPSANHPPQRLDLFQFQQQDH